MQFSKNESFKTKLVIAVPFILIGEWLFYSVVTITSVKEIFSKKMSRMLVNVSESRKFVILMSFILKNSRFANVNLVKLSVGYKGVEGWKLGSVFKNFEEITTFKFVFAALLICILFNGQKIYEELVEIFA